VNIKCSIISIIVIGLAVCNGLSAIQEEIFLSEEEKGLYRVSDCDYYQTTESSNDVCCESSFFAQLSCPARFCHTAVNADFLYWRPCVDGVFDFIVQDRSTSSTKLKTHSKMKCPIDDYRAGVRLGVSLLPLCASWDFGLQWVHYEPHQSRSHKISSTHDNGMFIEDLTEQIIPFGGLSFIKEAGADRNPDVVQLIDGFITSFAKGRWGLDLDIVDLEFGKHFQLGGCLFFRPHLAARWARVNQDLKIESEGVPFSTNSGFDGISYSAKKHFKNEFCGVGPRIGVDTQLELCCGWGLYGDVAASVLYGDRDASLNQEYSMVTGFDNEDFIRSLGKLKTSTNKHCLRAITDVALGVYWGTCLRGGDFDFNLKVGWEHHYFFNQSVAAAYTGDEFFSHQDKDLSMQGLTVSASLLF